MPILALHGISTGDEHERDLPPRAGTLMFEDGNSDFRTRACPVPKEFGLSSTVHLTTYYSLRRFPVFNGCNSYRMSKGHGNSVDLIQEAEQVRTATVCTSGLTAKDVLSPRLPRLIDTCCIRPLNSTHGLLVFSHLLPRRT